MAASRQLPQVTVRSPTPRVPSSSERIVSLDGLRGVAAASVVVYHISLADPTVGARAWRIDQTSDITWAGYLMTFTPLHVLWAGSQAVLVFFVLSGFVLALPFLRRPQRRDREDWLAFFRGRAVRLYLPGIVSLVLAFLAALVIKRSFDPNMPPWPNLHVDGNGPLNLLVGSSLMTGFDSLNGSLWSLRWEVLFSLTLPLFLAVAAWRVRLSWLKAMLLVLACAAWPALTGQLYPHATYLLIFGFGVLMAANVDILAAFAARLPTPGWVGLVVLGCSLLTLQWIVMPLGPGPVSLFDDLWMSYNSLGAVLLVYCAAFWPAAKRLLEWRPVHALGVVSFSLYLVQEPVVLNITLLTHSRLPLWLAIPAELGAAILLAMLFHRFVERPAHRLARTLGRRRPAHPQSTDLGPIRRGGSPSTSMSPRSAE